MLPPSSLVLSQGWGLIDLPLRASNEGSPRPRVARAQKFISLHPLPCSASKRTTRPPASPICWRTLHLFPPPPSASTPGCNILRDRAPRDRTRSPPPRAPRLVPASFAATPGSSERLAVDGRWALPLRSFPDQAHSL